MPGQSTADASEAARQQHLHKVRLSGKPLLDFLFKWERHLGNYIEFISVIKCNFTHTADAFVLVLLHVAQEVTEDAVLVAHPAATHRAWGGSWKGRSLPVGGKHIFLLWSQTLHEGRAFLGLMEERCANGMSLLALTLCSPCNAALDYSLAGSLLWDSRRMKPPQPPLEATQASVHLWTSVQQQPLAQLSLSSFPCC